MICRKNVVIAGVVLIGAAIGVAVFAARNRSEPLAVRPVASASAQSTPAAVDWPWWRGPAGDGKSLGAQSPTTWSERQNILWRTDVIGRGHSSPTIRGNRIYLTTADEEAQTQQLIALDRTSGKQLWTTIVHRGPLMHRHNKNSHASPTPATDDDRVYVAFISQDALWVTAADPAGKIVWQEKAGPFKSQHGYGGSPLLYKGLVIVCGDNAGPGYLAALDRKTGHLAWRTERAKSPSYSTPIIAQLCGRPQLLLSGASTVASYDPDTGERLWFCKGPTEVTACTMAFGPTIAYASGGYPGKEIMAIRADGTGDVSDTHVLWRAKESVTYVPSPLFHNGRLYVVNDQGIATCFAGDTGHVQWRKRLGGNFTSSPILVGDKIYVANEEGTTYVFKAADKYELIAENKLPESIYATPAVCDGHMYLRTANHLYCIGESQQAAATSATSR